MPPKEKIYFKDLPTLKLLLLSEPPFNTDSKTVKIFVLGPTVLELYASRQKRFPNTETVLARSNYYLSVNPLIILTPKLLKFSF